MTAITTPTRRPAPAAQLSPDRSVRLAQVRVTLVIAAVLVALPAVWLLITRGLPTIADDTPVHLMRLFVFDQHVRQGEWLPRWIPDLYTGYGYPLFHFYAPAMYYVAETLHLSGLGQATAYGWSYVLAVVFGAVGAAFLGSDLYTAPAGFDRQREHTSLAPRPSTFWPGLLAAAMYTYASYLLANVYVRGAFGEIGAQALLPWLFWVLRRMMLSPRRVPSIALGAVLLALLAMTHTITLLLALPWLVGYAAVLALALQRAGRSAWKSLGVPATAAALAALLSAAIWLPQLTERNALSASAWSTQLLLENLWRWRDFVTLDLRFRAVDGGQTPYQLSAIQAILLLLGLLFTRRRNAEWWLWVAILAICGALVSPLSAPLWANIHALAIIQFPWRLLSIMGLAVAIIGAGTATAFLTDTARAVGTGLLVAFVVITQAPRADETPFLTIPNDITLSLAAVNRFEQAEPAYGAGYDDEFLPRWVNLAVLQNPALPLPGLAAGARVAGSTPTRAGLAITNEGTAPLLLTLSQFYFPGWHVALDDGPLQAAQPDATTGLLSADIPVGQHTVQMRRTASTPAQAGAVLAIVGLAVLVIALFRSARHALLPAGAATLAIGLVWSAGMQPALPQASQRGDSLPLTAAPGLDLAGIDAAADRGQLIVRPLWFVRAHQPELVAEWRLSDTAGNTISALRSAPRFGTWSTAAWRPGALLQDTAELRLPPGLPAGAYDLALTLSDATTGAVLLPMHELLRIDLPEQSAVAATHTPAVAFAPPNAAPIATLGGVRATVDGKPLGETSSVTPGQRVAVDLLWQNITPEVYPYQSAIEIIDHAQQKVAALDLQVGWRSNVLNLWHDYLVPHERATLQLPDDLAGGLYTLRVAVRDRRTDERLSATDKAGNALGDSHTVTIFKVLGDRDQRPVIRLPATFGDAIELTGFTLAGPATVSSGGTVTVTLYYRARGIPATDSTRFLQLHSPALGMAAQSDAQPQNGANPTTSWRPDEVIAETVVLPIRPDASPGTYRLLLGFYDAGAGGARLPARDRHGDALSEDAVPLFEVTVAASPDE